MKRTLIASAIALVMLAGCKQQQQNNAAATAPNAPAAKSSPSNLTPEQLGELGAQIKKDPSRANELLSAHGLDDQSFEKEIRKITQDPVASKRYAAAYKNAS
jgi:hypothetical protein